MKIIDTENKKIEIKAKSIKEIIEKLNINLDEVIIIKNKNVITEDVKISNNDEIRFISVISKG